ncbi:hypothetical protein [Cellulomonas sp. ATA003]|uniref:hypothetical protein n=1 Tax=Cellulomonas sp. ATA003 TaxID=3073064 RepID=UPI002872E05B|nr:hypothetical protein [Cellulomonas sp. ATA003]WNB86503.1 hypothetical protein REH70_04510 [Cellulomonas sp. ATA003]
MPSFLVSGTAVPTSVTGDVSGIDDAVAGEEGVTVETATRGVDDGEVQFTLRITAPDADGALQIGRRIGDRLSPGSSVTLVE